MICTFLISFLVFAATFVEGETKFNKENKETPNADWRLALAKGASEPAWIEGLLETLNRTERRLQSLEENDEQMNNISQKLSTVIEKMEKYHPDGGPTLQEVGFDHGTAKASAIGDPKSHGPEHAFDDGNSYFYTPGGTPFPHLVWFQFSARFVPGRISIMPHQTSNNFGAYGPTKWQFIGSNGIQGKCSKDSSWTILCEDVSGKEFQRLGERKSCDVNGEMNLSFYCLGVKILDSGSGRPQASLSGIKMWKKY